jgi:hypothetical protein
MTLQYADIDDAVLATQQAFVKKGAFTDLQTDLTDHIAVRELWKGRKKAFDGGDPWEFDAQIDHNWSAKAVGMYERDSSAMTDTLIQGTVNVRHVNAHYVYDKREKAFQKGGKKIVDLIKSKYVGMMVSLFEYLEEVLWSEPADDNKTPFGVGYWVTRAASEGFNGPNPTNFSSGKAGISQLDQARWANWTAQYTAIAKEDLIRKMRKGARHVKFRSPVSHAQPKLGGMKNGVYTNDTVVGIMEEVLESQNMNLGNDIASKDGKTLFKGTPVTYAPYLDADTTDPVYMLDWQWLALGVLSGWENQLSKPYAVPDMHLVSRVDLDASLNMICTDLRRQAVFYTAS